MRKENSTNAINEQFLFQICELNSAIAIIGGRWKSQIVYSISQGNNRFHLLKKELPNISEQVLGRQLKELETHAVIVKKEIPETIPVGIQYVLTNKGLDLIPILESLCDWGKRMLRVKRSRFARRLSLWTVLLLNLMQYPAKLALPISFPYISAR